jgi:hypothetical protein
MMKVSLFKKKTFYGLLGRYLTVYTLLKVKSSSSDLSFCIHNFHRGDEDPAPHDHPFSFYSLVLIGGYKEFNEEGEFLIRKPLSFAYRSATHRHRVEPLTKHCWTICVKAKANREWGFWQDGHFIPWKEYLRAKGLEPIDDPA